MLLNSNVSLLSLTIPSWPNTICLKTVFETAEFWKSLLVSNDAPHQNQLTKCKNDGCRYLCYKIRLLRLVLTIFLLQDRDIIAQIDFAMKRRLWNEFWYRWSWLAITLQIRTEFLVQTRSKRRLLPWPSVSWSMATHQIRLYGSRFINQTVPKRYLPTSIPGSPTSCSWLYQTRCDCTWSWPLLAKSSKSWLRRVLQPPSRSRYRYGCPRIPSIMEGNDMVNE